MRITTIIFLTLLSVPFVPLQAQVEVYSDHLPIGQGLNSTSDEVNVVISLDGQSLYFTRKMHPENVGGSTDQGDIWVSEKDSDGHWTPAYNLKAVNSAEDNRIIGFMDTGRAMILKNGNNLGFSYKENGQWLRPSPFKVPYFMSKSSDWSASVSADGRHILFGMESYGSYGVEDIYIARLKTDGSWTSPKSLGATINTPNQEITPFLAADNKTLFFASNGRGGQGSFDIYMSVRQDDTWQNWSTPVNLGTRVNTRGWERSFTFLPDGTYAYLVSTQNSDGYGDIKRVKIIPDITPVEAEFDSTTIIDIIESELFVTISGSVVDKKSQQPIIGAEIRVITEPTDEVYNGRTNSEGIFSLRVKEGNNYVLKIQAYRYLSAEEVVADATVQSMDTLSYQLEPIVEGNTVTLNHVLFEQGKAILIQGSEKELNLVAEMMKFNPDISIFLSGHTDNQGKASLNVKLSQDRVQTVTAYLIAQGIKPSRISGQGFGGTRPIASNANDETRKLNRRVEFTVHKTDKQKSTDQ